MLTQATRPLPLALALTVATAALTAGLILEPEGAPHQAMWVLLAMAAGFSISGSV